ncbi:unnamed protein product [Cylindrotheca closterium]|uniref:Glycosyltransferase 61 catalytic domain-containing protein n=1 Tax=Cylindrotheca closterium TaxID=2856 RepID=A0AAD2FSL8_9STRA|nr:unnamed protein product [Cylindrotheca closterium]
MESSLSNAQSVADQTNPRKYEANAEYCFPNPNQPLAKFSHSRNELDLPRNDPDDDKYVRHVLCDYYGKNDAHFLHVMQQLYRCFSFWRDYPNKQAILLLPDAKVETKLLSHSFTKGIMQIFGSQMGLEMIMKSWFQEAELSDASHFSEIKMESFNRIGGYSIRHTKYLNYMADKEWKLKDNSFGTCENAKPRIAILNRASNYSRTILNHRLLSDQMKTLSRDNSVPVKYFEGLSFLEQVSFFRSVDILISPHGAQLTGLPFMNAPCAHIVELFPKGYAIPEMFGTLAIESGKDYSYLYISNNSSDMEQAKDRRQRKRARSRNLCPSLDVMVEAVRKLADDWRMCCGRRI